MSISRGAWSEEVSREFIKQQYFEYLQSLSEIAYQLQNEKKVCRQMSNTRLKEKIHTFLRRCRRKRYGLGNNMTYHEFFSIWDA